MASADDVLKYVSGTPATWAVPDSALRILSSSNNTIVMPTDPTLQQGKMMVQSRKGMWFLEATEANLRTALDGSTYMDSQGGLIQLPGGTINISGAVLAVPPYVEIRGTTVGGTIINQTTDSTDVFQCLGDTNTDSFIGDQRFVGLTITRSTQVTADYSTVTGNGIDVNGVHAPYIDRCTIVNQWAAIINKSTSSNIKRKYTRDLQIVNSGIGSCAAYGIKLDLPAPDAGHDYTANSFFMVNGAITGIYKVSSDANSGTGVRLNTFIKQNITEGSFLLATTMNGFSRHGVWITGSVFYMQNVQVAQASGHGLFLDRCRNVTILGCTFTLSGFQYGDPISFSTYDGIHIENQTGDSTLINSHIEIADNIIMQCGGNGIRIYCAASGNESNNIQISDNRIYANGMAGSTNDTAGIKIQIGPGAGTCPHLIIKGNRVNNDQSAVQDTNSLFSTMFGTEPQKFGLLYMNNGGGTPPAPSGWIIMGNGFYSSTTGYVSVQLNGASGGTPAIIYSSSWNN